MTRRIETAFVVPCDHPAFAGHFPGRPILPGVVLLAEAIAALEGAAGARGWSIRNAKFTSPVAPGTALAIVHEVDDAGAARFEIRAAERVVASGMLAPAPIP